MEEPIEIIEELKESFEEEHHSPQIILTAESVTPQVPDELLFTKRTQPFDDIPIAEVRTDEEIKEVYSSEKETEEKFEPSEQSEILAQYVVPNQPSDKRESDSEPVSRDTDFFDFQQKGSSS